LYKTTLHIYLQESAQVLLYTQHLFTTNVNLLIYYPYHCHHWFRLLYSHYSHAWMYLRTWETFLQKITACNTYCILFTYNQWDM